jgi:acetyl-CoA carboxylase carboxyltransferase component
MVPKDFQRVAIVSRGEPAVRLIRAIREYNQEHGTAIRSIALYQERDRHALFVRLADEALPLEAGLAQARADAVWTGDGVLADPSDYAGTEAARQSAPGTEDWAITECLTGLDLVKLQIHTARGGRIEGQMPRATAFARQVRLKVEGEERGIVERLRFPTGPGIRVDAAVAEGDGADADIAAITAFGNSEKEVLVRLRRAVCETVAVIRGASTNKQALLESLGVTERHDTIALAHAAINGYTGGQVALRFGGRSRRLCVYHTAPHRFLTGIDGRRIEAEIERRDRFESWLTIDSRRYHVVYGQGCIEVDGIAHHIESDDGGIVRAPAPAVVVSVCVRPGDAVDTGDLVATLEAMKMEMPITAPCSGTVQQVLTRPHAQVDAGTLLLQIGAGEAPEEDGDVDRPADLRHFLLGYDAGPSPSPNDEEMLRIFADISYLFHHDPQSNGSTGEQPSLETCFLSYAQNLERRAAGLPDYFAEALKRALDHYGLHTFDPTPKLRNSIARIFKSHNRQQEQIAPILAILERISTTDLILLDRLIAVARDLSPAIHDLARDLRYHLLHPPRLSGRTLKDPADLWRLTNFNLERQPSPDSVDLFHAVAHADPKDERLFAFAELDDFGDALSAIRRYQAGRRPHERLVWNRIFLRSTAPLDLPRLLPVFHEFARESEGAGLEQIQIRDREMLVRIAGPGTQIAVQPVAGLQPLEPLNDYCRKIVRMRRRGLLYPYEIIKMLTPFTGALSEFPCGDFVEYDLDASGRLVAVDRPHGRNTANMVVGVIRNYTAKCPEGMERVVLLGDPSKDLGALAEPECRRIIAALDLAAAQSVPLEWYAISAGARISMTSGVENMDWIARVLRRLIEFTQDGGEVNVIVHGINVGAQPYWNAEATMLMHTRGILIMMPGAAMVLTGKRALDYSGGVSAEDNHGIGGYDRTMGLNGQAQYWARDIAAACQILLRHYEHTYVMPGERFPRRAESSDRAERDVQNQPGIAEILNGALNPSRKKPFAIREVMAATIDQDHAPLERWAGMRAAETAVVWDAHLGGYPVCLIGIESRPVPRLGLKPVDGPGEWCGGTLFPLSSKKVARAINAASNNRPVVILANLSGFDGSPESMRKLQLEYGAEIGRAVVNFTGPMVFCVISRYHGGAYVVFSRALNENLRVASLEGTYASVIGGAPAAAVVFAGEVEARARKDARLQGLKPGSEEWERVFEPIHSEKLGEVAREYDQVHSVHRALQVGALHQIIPPADLRCYLIRAVAEAVEAEQACACAGA